MKDRLFSIAVIALAGMAQGQTIERLESLGGAAFKVENPQAAAGCGCGSSFGI